MKKILLSSFAFFLGGLSIAQVPILYYDFESNASRNSSGESTVEMAVNPGNSAFTRRGSGTLGYTAGAGSLYSGNNGRAATSTQWPVLQLDPGAGATNYYQFTANTEGLKGLSVACDLARSLTGPQFIGVTYSTDGVNFTPLTTSALFSSFTPFTVDLPANAENRSQVTIRLYGFFAVSSLGDLLIDNVQLRATTFTGVKTLPDLDQVGLCMASGKAFTPTITNLHISGSGTVVTLNGKLKLASLLQVTEGAVFSCGANAMLIGNGAVINIADDCVLQIASSNVQGALKGNLGSNVFILNPDATVEYTGTAPQYLDASAVMGNVIINNNKGVDMLGDVVINGDLTLQQGSLDANANTLTLKGDIARSSGKLDVSKAEIIFSGSTKQIVEASIFQGSIKRLNSSNSVGVRFESDLTVSEALVLTAGTLEIGNKKLTLSGALSRNGITESGTLDAAEGSVELNGSIAQSLPAGAFVNNRVKSLRISNSHSGGVSLDGTVTVTDVLDFGAVNNSKLKSNGHLVLKSDANGTARVGDLTNGGANNGNAIEGAVTVERYSPAWSTRRYRLLTSPVLNTTINEAWQEGTKWNGTGTLPGTGYGTLITGQAQGTAATANQNGFDFWTAIAGGQASVRVYVPSSSSSGATWQGITSTLIPNAFNNHESYLVFIRGDRSVSAGTTAGAATLRGKGNLKTGSFTLPVPAKQSHTLIGNPYAAPLDFKQLYDANSTKIQPWFWVWQAGLGTGTGGYVLVRPVSAGSSLYEAIPGDGSRSAANRLIHSGEGIFVMPAPGVKDNNTITIQETHKSTGTPAISVFREQGLDEGARIYVNMLTTIAGNKALLDGIMAEYSVNGSQTGVGKSYNATENLSILRNSSDLIVSGGPVPAPADTLKLRLWNTVNKEYQLAIRSENFANAGLEPVLVDRYLKTETPVSSNSETIFYPFTVTADAASRNQQRFYITYRSSITLPLVVSHISAEAKTGSNVIVQWRAADETGIRTYGVERSFDGINFSPISTVAARAGTGDQSYSYLDSQASLLNYYRVKMTGTTGEVNYSAIVKAQLQKAVESFTLYPNPIRGSSFNLQWVNKPKGVYTLTLYTITGQVVLTKTVLHRGGTAVETIGLTEHVLPGNYKLEIKNEAGGKEFMNISVLQ
ncbi:MAG TPA: T9SS type A sorting domain-containing protein [Flavisolibacter sp.]|jgi:hypothetical protein|nr:T9SS type A sorting domain-containing protein [Flavisolibacter sp.]